MGAMVATDRCEWCEHEHARDALCTSRPKWSRRGFLALFGAGVAGLAVAPSLPQSDTFEAWYAIRHEFTPRGLDAILKEIYQPVIERQLRKETLSTLWAREPEWKREITIRVDAR